MEGFSFQLHDLVESLSLWINCVVRIECKVQVGKWTGRKLGGGACGCSLAMDEAEKRRGRGCRLLAIWSLTKGIWIF